KFLKVAAIAAVSSFAVAGAANAAITTSILGDGSYGSYVGAGQTMVQDFDAALAPGYIFGTTNPFFIGTGSANGLYAEPPGTPGNYIAVQSANGTDGSATLTSLGGFTNFSLFMGSPDTYNSITFTFFNAPSVTLSGTQISNGGTLFPTTGDQSLAYRVNFYFGGDVAKSVTLQSIGQNAYESDGWAVSAVPEPATWAMMITGFGLAGAAIRRRRNILAVA
ncbi:MAG: PEPxxWA-CTERM sorting domain-containing protein, partial [Phenylobacterium sp.]|uniref:PEPxxWA-CTERM sorting domain-containing protein n=1 Tax=Phenylobacterium sp. TaxID=1871053 RepID=UPI0027291BC4